MGSGQGSSSGNGSGSSGSGPGNGAGKGQGQAKGQSKGASLQRGPEYRTYSWSVELISSAHAQQQENYGETNRILYEFGELMRRNAHSSDDASCLSVDGPCTVTVKF
jgi:hypothetical protein